LADGVTRQAELATGGSTLVAVHVVVLADQHAVDHHAVGAAEQAVGLAANASAADIGQEVRVETQIGHAHRGHEHVVQLLATSALDRADEAVLGGGFHLHQRFVGQRDQRTFGGVVTGTAAQACRSQVEATVGRRGHAGIRGELQVGQILTGRQYRTQRAVGVAGVRDRGQAQERHLVDTVSRPVTQRAFRSATEVHDRLLVSHATGDAVGVTDLVEQDDRLEALERLFVVLQLSIPHHTISPHIGEQGDDGPVALFGLLELGGAVDHCVHAGAGELGDERVGAGVVPELLAPRGKLLVGQSGKIGQCHGWLSSCHALRRDAKIDLRSAPRVVGANESRARWGRPAPLSWGPTGMSFISTGDILAQRA